MIAADESALVCDLAETYQIYNYRSLPASLVATFCVGLRENSRIKMKMSGAKLPHDTLILAMIFDRIGDLAWSLGNGTDRPPSLVKVLCEEVKEDKKKSKKEDKKKEKDKKKSKNKKDGYFAQVGRELKKV